LRDDEKIPRSYCVSAPDRLSVCCRQSAVCKKTTIVLAVLISYVCFDVDTIKTQQTYGT